MSFGALEAEPIAAAWNDTAPARFRLDADLVRQNLLTSPLLDRDASFGDTTGFVAIKRSAAELYGGPDPLVYHLSLFSEPRRFLGPTIEALRAKGAKALVVGMDSGHFLPGLPVEMESTARILESFGFVGGGVANDLERDLRDYEAPLATDAEFRTLIEEDVQALDAFFIREFPGRWRFDVMGKVSVEGPSTVFGLFLQGVLEGFALLQSDGCRKPIGGAVWRNDLGPDWGSLGPIGISAAVRGHGHGNALLGQALAELRRRGARQSIIDWTSLVDFYGAHGFAVTRRYRSYRLDL